MTPGSASMGRSRRPWPRADDFSAFESIGDVGAATGNMLGHVLARHPQPRGSCSTVPTSSRKRRRSWPPGAWEDRMSIEERCLTILGNCRRVMKPGARLLIVEFVPSQSIFPETRHGSACPQTLRVTRSVGPSGGCGTFTPYRDARVASSWWLLVFRLDGAQHLDPRVHSDISASLKGKTSKSTKSARSARYRKTPASFR